MLRITRTQSIALRATLKEMFSNGDADMLWNKDEKATASITRSLLLSGAKSFGIITDDFKTVIRDTITAGERLETITPRLHLNLVLSANQAGIAIC